jgi:hypothetical protein
MASVSDVILARFAATAYLDTPSGLPPGFAPVPNTDLGITIDTPGESFANGVYRNQNAAALVGSGQINGQPTLVLAFRGSDDRQDSINSLRNINADFADFTELVAALDAYASRAGVGQVAVTGHSLGGAMTQLFMEGHPATGAATRYTAATFGSPGALINDGPDARISNFVIADDPAVFLGENRAAVGSELRGHPLLAGAAIFTASDVFPGLTPQDALESLSSLTVDYENRGETVLLPGKSGSTTPISSLAQASQADPAEHQVELYAGRVTALVGIASVSRNGVSTLEAAQAYAGPVSYLQWQFLGSAQGEAVAATSANDFLNLAGGNDAADGGAGDDVLDGGTGSNFLIGGAGRDVFFLDGRGAASGTVTWSTIADWQAGEQLSLWGWRPGVTRALWVDDDGAAAFRGVTLHADIDGNGTIDNSVTWAGVSRAQLPVAQELDGLLWFA